MTELDIEQAVASFLKRKGGIVHRQVPFLRKIADICVYDVKLDRLLAIEAKLENWRRAIQQARYYQLFADGAYIAVPASCLSRIRMEELADIGVGLIVVGRRVRVKHCHGENIFLRNACRELVLEYLQAIEPRNSGANNHAIG